MAEKASAGCCGWHPHWSVPPPTVLMGYSCVKFIIELTLTDLSEAAKPVREPADEPVQGGETYLVEVVSGSGMIGSLRAGYSHSEPVEAGFNRIRCLVLCHYSSTIVGSSTPPR